MERINRIQQTDYNARKLAEEKWNSAAKPLGSLGILEEIISSVAAVFGTPDFSIDKRTAVVMCGDNGVVAENVTQSDSEVTAIVANSVADGKSNINAVARICKADVIGVDIGISKDIDNPGLINRKIAYGTRNIAYGAAMSLEEAEKSLCVGMDIVRELKEKGTKIIAVGEMGIGNTTTTSALASVLLGLPPRETTGRGAGLTSEGLERKIKVIEKAIEINKPDKTKPIELLSKLGGFDIAGMTGLFLGAAYYKLPVIIDGAISAVSALIASEINHLSVGYMLASHCSAEPVGRMILSELGLKAVIQADMRLGEGTGALMLLPLIDSAMEIYDHSHRFDELGMERYEKLV